jgi:hypothetical protein
MRRYLLNVLYVYARGIHTPQFDALWLIRELQPPTLRLPWLWEDIVGLSHIQGVWTELHWGQGTGIAE